MKMCIALTNECMLDCVSCLTGSGSHAQRGLPADTLRHVLGWLAEQEAPQVDFSGGEPLARADARDLIRHAKSLDIAVNVCSNGWVTDRRDLDLLTDVRKVIISFYGLEDFHDGVTRVPGSFARAIHTIGVLRGSKSCLRANVVILAGALPGLPLLAEQLQEAGVDEIKLSVLSPAGRASALTSQLVTRYELEDLVQSLIATDGYRVPITLQRFGPEPFPCRFANRTQLLLAHDGHIYPCPFLSYVGSPIAYIADAESVSDALDRMDWPRALRWLARTGENHCPAISLGLFSGIPNTIVHHGCPPLAERRQAEGPDA